MCGIIIDSEIATSYLRMRVTIENEGGPEGGNAFNPPCYVVRPVITYEVDGSAHDWIGSGDTREAALESAERFLTRCRYFDRYGDPVGDPTYFMFAQEG